MRWPTPNSWPSSRQQPRRLVETIDERLADPTTIPIGVVHHDPHPGNDLFGRGDRLIALLDFDEAHIAPWVVDLAALIHYWAADESPWGFSGEFASELVRAYESQRSLTAGERELLPDAIRLYHAGDAANYLVRVMTAAPKQRFDLESCRSYRHFRVLMNRDDWIGRLRDP